MCLAEFAPTEQWQGVAVQPAASTERCQQELWAPMQECGPMQMTQPMQVPMACAPAPSPMYMMMPVFVYVPVPSDTSLMSVPEAPAVKNGSEAHFVKEPRQEFRVKNTFVHVDETERVPARKRRSSCPANVLRLKHERKVVMLANLPNRAKESQVLEHVAKLQAEVIEAELPLDKRTGVNRGYAFLTFESEALAEDFIAAVEGTQLAGSRSKKRLAATFAKRPQVKALPRTEQPALTGQSWASHSSQGWAAWQ